MQQILEMLGQQLGGDPIRQLAGRLGAGTAETSSAVAAALPMLLSGLGQTAQSSGGAAGLGALLDQHHGSGLLDDLAGFFGQGDHGPGAGILGQLLGDRHAATQQAIGRASGLSGAQVGQLLALLAPMVLSFLARMRQGGMAPAPAGGAAPADGGLGGLLGGLLGGGGGASSGGGGGLGSILGGGDAGLGGLLGGLLGGGGAAPAAPSAPSGAVSGGGGGGDSDLDDLAAQGAKILGGLLGG